MRNKHVDLFLCFMLLSSIIDFSDAAKLFLFRHLLTKMFWYSRDKNNRKVSISFHAICLQSVKTREKSFSVKKVLYSIYISYHLFVNTNRWLIRWNLFLTSFNRKFHANKILVSKSLFELSLFFVIFFAIMEYFLNNHTQ